MKHVARIALVVALLIGGMVGVGWCQENLDKYVQELNKKTTAAFKKGDLQQGAILAEHAYRYALEYLGPKHPDTLVAGSNLVELYYTQGHYEKAKNVCEENLRLRTDVLGEKHQDTLESMGNMAMLHQTLGELEKAEELSKKVFEISKDTLGAEDEHTLLSMNN